MPPTTCLPAKGPIHNYSLVLTLRVTSFLTSWDVHSYWEKQNTGRHEFSTETMAPTTTYSLTEEEVMIIPIRHRTGPSSLNSTHKLTDLMLSHRMALFGRIRRYGLKGT